MGLRVKIVKVFTRHGKELPSLIGDFFSFSGWSSMIVVDPSVFIQNFAMSLPNFLSGFREFLISCYDIAIESSVTGFSGIRRCILNIVSVDVLTPGPILVAERIVSAIFESIFEVCIP